VILQFDSTNKKGEGMSIIRKDSIKGVKRVTASLIIAGLVLMLTVSIAIAHGTVDQDNPGPPYVNAGSLGGNYVWGQTFIPQEDTIVSVDLGFVSPFPINAQTVIVSIREGSGIPNNPDFIGIILGSATKTVSIGGGTIETIHFDFPSTIPLIVGNTYLIEVKSTDNNPDLHLVFTPDLYLGGGVYSALDTLITPYTEYDMVFTTYYSNSKSDILKDRGIPGKGLDKAPGLQKDFNDNR
jgi:hypothetical protein